MRAGTEPGAVPGQTTCLSGTVPARLSDHDLRVDCEPPGAGALRGSPWPVISNLWTQPAELEGFLGHEHVPGAGTQPSGVPPP
jgi:hypothetical protein